MVTRIKIAILLCFVGVSTQAQFDVNMMFYNVLRFPNAQPDRIVHLDAIVDSYAPDIFMVCELSNAVGAQTILDNALQTTDNKYSAATFTQNQSTFGTDLQQMLYYNNQKFLLQSQQVYTTDLRDINRYTLVALTTDQAIDPLTIEVFVTHFKAGSAAQGANNESRRLLEAQTFTGVITTIPANSYVIFAGDFNLYSSSEPAYQELLDSTNAIVMVDPINTPGAWSNNSSFQSIHTQSAFSFTGGNNHVQDANGNGTGATGGMDDRFDFILMSQNLQTGPELQYTTGTYKAYGNNGNCFNDSVNDPACVGTYSQGLRDELWNMSDHLPVVMQLRSNKTLSITSFEQEIAFDFVNSNWIDATLSLNAHPNLNGETFYITDTTGKRIYTTTIQNTLEQHDVSGLTAGLYYVVLPKYGTILKFIKRS